MPGSKQFSPPIAPPHPPRIDLSEVTEATRRALYDATVAVHFRVPPGTEEGMPFYNADQAGLTVWFGAGRWWAQWNALEETDNANLPPAAKYQLLHIRQAPEGSGAPFGVEFHGV